MRPGGGSPARRWWLSSCAAPTSSCTPGTCAPPRSWTSCPRTLRSSPCSATTTAPTWPNGALRRRCGPISTACRWRCSTTAARRPGGCGGYGAGFRTWGWSSSGTRTYRWTPRPTGCVSSTPARPRTVAASPPAPSACCASRPAAWWRPTPSRSPDRTIAGIPSVTMTDAIPRSRRGRPGRPGAGASQSGRARLRSGVRGQPEHAERRQGNCGRGGLAVRWSGDGLDGPEVADAAAAVLGGVGVDHLAPPAGGGQPDPVVVMRAAREVRHASDEPGPGAPFARTGKTQDSQNLPVGVGSVEPAEPARAEILPPPCGLLAVHPVPVPDQALQPAVEPPGLDAVAQRLPVEAGLLGPLGLLAALRSHGQQLPARMRPLTC